MFIIINVIITLAGPLDCSLPTPLPLVGSAFYYDIIIHMCVSEIQKYGANPANIQWTVVRGDTATLRIDFLESDEQTHFDTSGWTYKATAYDPSGDFLDPLSVESFSGYITITANPNITKNWGTSFRSVVAELPFDVQVKIPGEIVSSGQEPSRTWTPVIGTICVLGDVTIGGSL